LRTLEENITPNSYGFSQHAPLPNHTQGIPEIPDVVDFRDLEDSRDLGNFRDSENLKDFRDSEGFNFCGPCGVELVSFAIN
jgi:hypothetical protein